VVGGAGAREAADADPEADRQHDVEDHRTGRLADGDLVRSPVHHQQVGGEHGEQRGAGENPDPGGDVHGPPPVRTAASRHRRSLPPGSPGRRSRAYAVLTTPSRRDTPLLVVPGQYPPPWVRFVTRVPEITRSFGGPGPASRPSLEAGSTTGGGRAGAGARVLGSALAPFLGAAGQSPLTLTVGGPPLLSLAVGGDPRI